MLQPSNSFSESVFQRSSLSSLFEFVVLDDLEEATRPEETECTDDLLGRAFMVVVNSSSLESESSESSISITSVFSFPLADSFAFGFPFAAPFFTFDVAFFVDFFAVVAFFLVVTFFFDFDATEALEARFRFALFSIQPSSLVGVVVVVFAFDFLLRGTFVGSGIFIIALLDAMNFLAFSVHSRYTTVP
jgi:hypothetical protein